MKGRNFKRWGFCLFSCGKNFQKERVLHLMKQVSVCRFKVSHKRIKILNLSFDGIDYEKELGKLNEIIMDKNELQNLVC